MPRRVTDINAVHEDDTDALLDILGVRDAFRHGRLACDVCGQPLRDKEVGAIRQGPNGPTFACSRLTCIRSMSSQSYLAEK